MIHPTEKDKENTRRVINCGGNHGFIFACEEVVRIRTEERIKTLEEVKSKFRRAMSCYAFANVLDELIEQAK